MVVVHVAVVFHHFAHLPRYKGLARYPSQKGRGLARLAQALLVLS